MKLAAVLAGASIYRNNVNENGIIRGNKLLFKQENARPLATSI